MGIVKQILGFIGNAIHGIMSGVTGVFEITDDMGQIYTAFARWVFILLALYILLRQIISLIRSRNPSEVWAYLHIGEYENVPLTHWENVLGRAGSCDVRIDDMSVSRNHGTLTRENDGRWKYMDLGSKNGALLNGVKIRPTSTVRVNMGDTLQLGASTCMLYPISVEEKRNNQIIRQEYTIIPLPWTSLLAITLFQIMTVIQLHIALGDRFTQQIIYAFGGLTILMWVYVFMLRAMKRRGFEMEMIAFFLSTLSLAVTSTCLPDQVFKQFVAIALGVALFLFMCTYLRDLERTVSVRNFLYIVAAALLLFNLIFGTNQFGASNWVNIGGISFQPSEIVKLAFIWVGSATMNELFDRQKTMIFTGFSVFCFGCLALMGDFGTAVIFFVTFVIMSFLRSGDVTKLFGILGVAFACGLLVLRFKAYVAERFASWGHVWENDVFNAGSYQQTRTMTASASDGYVGLGAGNGWLRDEFASETDLVFGVLTEEWGLIIAVMAVLSIITLSIFAFRSIWAGRSTYYTIAACSAMSIFLFQTMLNVFGSVDLLPLTGVTFPFVAAGGTSMIASWGLLAFLKAADTRQNASIAVTSHDEQGGEEA